jgi:hypothetical protein
MASVLPVLARGAGGPFEIEARFSFSDDVAVTEGGIVAVGAEGVAAASLSGTADWNAVPRASFHSASLYNSSLLDELANLGKGKRFDIQGIHEIHCGLLIYSDFQVVLISESGVNLPG